METQRRKGCGGMEREDAQTILRLLHRSVEVARDVNGSSGVAKKWPNFSLFHLLNAFYNFAARCSRFVSEYVKMWTLVKGFATQFRIA
uniref:Uncharacterized protein n=1 Tax=Globodera rostochiensis TaxID=31243 RepID=A0A914HPT8_GLORO